MDIEKSNFSVIADNRVTEIKAEIVVALNDYIETHSIKQRDVAEQFGTKQTEISKLKNSVTEDGKPKPVLEKFSLNKLIEWSLHFGIDVNLSAQTSKTFSFNLRPYYITTNSRQRESVIVMWGGWKSENELVHVSL